MVNKKKDKAEIIYGKNSIPNVSIEYIGKRGKDNFQKF